jgi:hypothetical protein
MRWFESSHPSHWFESSHPSIAWRARRLKTLTRGGYALRLGFLLAVFAVSCTVSRNASGLPPLESSTGWRTAEPRFEREQLWGPPGANRWEPTIAADPESSWVYQLTTGQRPNYLLFRASSDGGRTWGAARHLCHRGVRVPFQFDPQIAVAKGGVIDVVCLDGFRPGVVFARSHDRGATWSKAVRLDGRMAYSDKPTLVLAARGKDVYVAYNVRWSLYVSVSHDYGATWLPATRATTRRLWYFPYSGTVGRHGAIWFAVDGESGRKERGEGHVELVTSPDGGMTWREIPFAVSYKGETCKVHHCYPDFYTAEDAVAADGRGNLVFVFAMNARRHGPNALYVSRSNDDGATWSASRLVNAVGNNTSPAIAAAPDGSFRLVWQDNRNGPKAWNTWYSQSSDRGASWSNAIRLSDQGFGAPYKHAAGYDFPFGDYLGLAVDTHGVNHVIWGEGSAVYVPGGTWWTRGL